MSIDDLFRSERDKGNLDTRCAHIVNRAIWKYGVKNIASLKALNDIQWFSISGCGKRSLSQIKNWLNGLSESPKVVDGGDDFFSEVAAKHNANQAKWGGDAHDDTHELADWILFVERELLDMKGKHYTGLGNTQEMFVSLAAVCLAGFNSIKRKASVSP